MTTAIVPQSLDTLGSNELFQFNEYNPLQTYGPDRIAFQQLRRVFDAHDEELATIDTLAVDDIDTCIFIDMNYDYLSRLLSRRNRPTLIYIMREPPSVVLENTETRLLGLRNVFDAVLSWNPTLATVDRVHEYNIPQYLGVDVEDPPDYAERSLLVNVSSRRYSSHPNELYSAREHVIQFYDEQHPDQFALYGPYWNDRPGLSEMYHYNKFSYDMYETYHGLAESKSDVYEQHRFALCFENMTGVRGYVTEKIFDCFRAGTVPIYWGADDITEYVPAGSFIDYREFGSPCQLHEYLCSMSEAEYLTYIDTAQEFMKSEPDSVTPAQYAETVYRVVATACDSPTESSVGCRAETIHYNGANKRFSSKAANYSFPKYVMELWRMVNRTKSVPEAVSYFVESVWQRYH
jgi:hypothetical protein